MAYTTQRKEAPKKRLPWWAVGGRGLTWKRMQQPSKEKAA